MINITQALQITCILLSSGMCGAAYAHRDGDQRGGPAIIWDNEAGDGLFFNPMNWDPDGVPGLNDEALISMGGPVTAANMPIEVERLTVQSGLNLESSSIQVQFLSSVNNLITTGCCATGIDSGIEKLIIKGDSFLFKRAIFLGASTELQDTTTFFDGSTIRADSSLSIKGEAIYASNVHSMEAMGEVDIDGTLNLQTATLFSSGNPGAQWVFNSGTLMASGTGESNVSDQLSMTNGLILADGAQLDINQRYEITDSEARVLNNGTLRFLNGSTSDPYKLGITTFDGNGRIVIDGNQVKLDPSSGITIASVEGTGLEIRGSLRMLGELSNTKNMRLNGGVIDSDVGFGRLTCDAGTLTVQSNSTCLTEIVIRSGATMSIDARLSLLGEIRIDPGALLLLNSVIGPTTNNVDANQLYVNGLLRVPNTSTNSTAIQQTPVNLSSSGQINLQDRQLVVDHGGELNAGSITLEDTANAGFPQLFFGGEFKAFNFRNGVTISNSGERAEVYFGNGFGGQPGMQVDGDLVINITGEQSAAHIRVPQIDAIADSRIHNMGKLILERNATHHESIENSGELSINATTVMRGLETLNNEGGMIIQSSIIETSTGVSVRNFGTWNCRSSSQIKLAMDTDAASTFFLNGGEFLASSGTTSVDIAFLNEGQVTADGAEVIFSRTTTVDQDGRRVLSGKWKTINGGRITVSQDPPTVVAGEETIIEGEGSGFSFVEDLEFIKSGAKVRLGFAELTKPLVINSGSLNVKPNATIDVRGTVTAILESEVNVEPGATLNADGAINVGSADPMTPSVLDDLSGSIAIARGNPNPPNVNAPMINIHANLTPIRGDTGTMNTSGLLTIHPTGTLRINAEANGISSAIDHTGDLDITGSISITPIQGYEPQLGDSFTIATVSGTIGSLPAQAIDTSGSGLTFSVGAVGSDVVVTVIESCPADLNMDGTLNFFDVSAFLTAFISMDPIADFTGDGIFNFFDVSAFLASYSAGCP